ncbi:MAG: hypothetical protein EXQ88_01750 [Alphaproteobacteria bacterium]|nr:hypothetical protein [Alphaproteobacteria bacterium]
MDEPSQLTLGLLGVVTAYILLAVLLLSVNVASRWLWWIKGVAIVATTLFFVQSYASVTGLIGWPTKDQLPGRFEFLWASVAEPNKFYNIDGSVFMWIVALGAGDEPLGEPRAFRVPYTLALSEQIVSAQALMRQGKAVAGYARLIDVAASSADALLDAQARGAQRVNALRPENFTERAVEVLLEVVPGLNDRPGGPAPMANPGAGPAGGVIPPAGARRPGPGAAPIR